MINIKKIKGVKPTDSMSELQTDRVNEGNRTFTTAFAQINPVHIVTQFLSDLKST